MGIKYLRNDVTSTRKAIKELDKQKQDLLIAGLGIEIDENNVISVSGGTGKAAEYHTTQYYYEHRTTVYPQGSILVYSDYRQDEQGNNIPGIKVADGTTMVQYLPFITEQSDEVADEALETASEASETAQEAQGINYNI